MKIKITGTLVLLAAFAGFAAAQPVKAIKNIARSPAVLTGKIVWSKSYGIIPAGPGYSQASGSPCGQFFVAATNPSTGQAIATTSAMTFDDGGVGYYYKRDVYTCTYRLPIPKATPLYIIAGMGGSLLLPKMDEDPHYLTDAWIGGNYNKPPPGSFRTFTGSQSVNVTPEHPNTVVNFELVYARKDNPK